jgi:DNA-binding transcriptional regulator YdaS (Cro superfamily)
MARDPVLLEAIKAAGGPGAVGAALRITREAVQQWKRCPAERVLQLEHLSSVSRHNLRPDLYPAAHAAPEAA